MRKSSEDAEWKEREAGAAVHEAGEHTSHLAGYQSR